MTAGFHYRFKRDYAVAVTADFTTQEIIISIFLEFNSLKWGGGNCISAQTVLYTHTHTRAHAHTHMYINKHL